MVKLKCSNCGSNDTIATYIHGACQEFRGKPFQWFEEALGNTPDGTPRTRPCPGCETAGISATSVTCQNCWNTWYCEGDTK